jgi:predicted ATPase
MSAEYGDTLWQTRAKGFAGWLNAFQGDPDNGLTMLSDAIREIRMAGILQNVPCMHAMLADVHVRTGHFDRAETEIEKALAICSRTEELWPISELHRMRGELCRDEAAKAERHFQHALIVAREQGAKLFELRTSVSLARLWRDHGRLQDARNLVTSSYDWFTEGFDAPDLIEARLLLEELGSAPDPDSE